MALTFWGGSTGTGKVVRETSPTLVTPTLGVADCTALRLTDGIVAPAAVATKAIIFVDTSGGDLKVEFGDDFGAVIQADS
jgi:hypothetical protein